MEKRFYRIMEVAKILGVTRVTVYKLIKKGDIQAIKIGGEWYIPKAFIEKLEKGGTKNDG